MSYQFKVGDKGKTREGKAYEVLAVDHDFKDRPVIAKIADSRLKNRWYLARRATDGTAEADGDAMGIDLMPPTRTVYVNAYANGAVISYETSEQAKKAANNTNLYWKIVLIAHPLEIPLG